MTQTTVPGFERWHEDEQRYLTTLERDRAQTAHGPPPNAARVCGWSQAQVNAEGQYTR